MKKLLHFFLCLIVVLSFSACGDIPLENGYDASMLYGKWQEGSVFEQYYSSKIERVLANGDTVQVNGTTWDEGDDVSEDEAQLFNWTLTGSTLKHEHVGTFGHYLGLPCGGSDYCGWHCCGHDFLFGTADQDGQKVRA